MPIYEYECAQCGQIEEVIQHFSDAPLTTCRHCAGKLHKIISQSTFHLKGSGWYVTDYAGKKTLPTSTAKTETATAKDTPAKKTAEKSSKPAAGKPT